ncbi:hypothetical protein L596_002069 [Steinernema carpocapsae]|uniref:Uncharacterized protein n=1 Tax=Steinernema carpocapsae TaxID=34508 RepID=A0A4U8UQR6_STECR|nr:hypothetical protein L596_002069 [Steinernema carpocapsae]
MSEKSMAVNRLFPDIAHIRCQVRVILPHGSTELTLCFDKITSEFCVATIDWRRVTSQKRFFNQSTSVKQIL